MGQILKCSDDHKCMIKMVQEKLYNVRDLPRRGGGTLEGTL